MRNLPNHLPGRLALALLLLVPGGPLLAENHLVWNLKADRVSADVKSENVDSLLEKIAETTGWQIYLEPGIAYESSAKFKDERPGEALRLLLGNLNFALIPQATAPSRLYVFRTSQARATRLIRPATKGPRASKLIPNELIVRLKPGAKIEDLARLVGAKIIGRIDALNTYRLEFADEAAARSAREALLDNPDVTGVDSNFTVDRPSPQQEVAGGIQPSWNLKPKDGSDPCRPIVALVDTPVSVDSAVQPFVLPSISVTGSATSPPADLTHGTAMLEAILQSIQSNMSGGRTGVKILPVDVYGANSTTTTFEVGQGIYQAVNAGANIVNLSLGGSGDSAFVHGLITSASKLGVVFFGAAGNEPLTTATYPAAYPEVIAVTASDPAGQLANYANHGSFVSIMAPGTSFADFQGQSYVVTGTSSATAFASGLAAGLADSTQACPDRVIPTIRNQLGVKFTSP
ncbi:MAG TPA: S8 family serine peptidase [Verrucomicrobiae bacterium]|nr:S8 family serine peptidase [Verrucomicrobiae bacterium]